MTPGSLTFLLYGVLDLFKPGVLIESMPKLFFFCPTTLGPSPCLRECLFFGDLVNPEGIPLSPLPLLLIVLLMLDFAPPAYEPGFLRTCGAFSACLVKHTLQSLVALPVK